MTEPCRGIYHNFKAAGAVAEYQLVKFGADADTVTGTTVDADSAVIGVAVESISSADATAGRTFCVRLLGSVVVPMIAGGTITLGSKLEVEGTSGRVISVGTAAAADARNIVGIALGATTTAGDYVPVLVK